MSSPLKIGVISGLIAGFVLGIVYEIFSNIAVLMGLFEHWWRPIATHNIVVNIPLFGFWGMILGIIYSKVYNAVPRKGVTKGLIYGLILYFIIQFRIYTWDLAYGRFLSVAGGNFSGFFSYLSFGLVLAILYEFLRGRYHPAISELRPEGYDMRGGMLPGAIAGFSGGLAASIAATALALGLIKYPEGGVPYSFDLWLSLAGALILLNLIWGTVFGAILPKVYSLVPGEKVKRGLYYGLITFLVTSFLCGVNVTVWGLYHNALSLVSYFAWALFVAHGANAVTFGLVLGGLYKR